MELVETSEIRNLRTTIGDETHVDQLNKAAAMIRKLAGVSRVRVNQPARHLEILFEHPMPGLVREIHSLLQFGSSELPTSKIY